MNSMSTIAITMIATAAMNTTVIAAFGAPT
jgi:hypothetical protein